LVTTRLNVQQAIKSPCSKELDDENVHGKKKKYLKQKISQNIILFYFSKPVFSSNIIERKSVKNHVLKFCLEKSC